MDRTSDESLEKLKLDPFFSNYQNYYQKLDIRRKLLSFEESQKNQKNLEKEEKKSYDEMSAIFKILKTYSKKKSENERSTTVFYF